MKSVFNFDTVHELPAGQYLRRTTFFFGRYGLNLQECYLAVDGHFSNNPIADEIVFFGLSDQVNVLCAALRNTRILNRMRIRLDGNARLIYVTYNGQLHEKIGPDFETEIPANKELCRYLQHEGASAIFRNNHGMLEASESHHYVKPSLKHTDRFIRSGSVLVAGTEIDFLAIWMLPMISIGIKNIYTDSSTINSVAYALISLRNRLAPETHRAFPSIQSFESYKGLGDNTFFDLENLLVIVSASSGGAMMLDLVLKYKIKSNRICTLYYLGSQKPTGSVICDLTANKKNPTGYKPAIVTKRGDRGTFPPESLPIHILAEAFVPENPIVEPTQVLNEDIPKWWEIFAASFIGMSAVRCFAPPIAEQEMSKPPRWPVSINVKSVLQADSPFSKKLDFLLRTTLPATIDTLIVFDDDASKEIAKRVLKLLKGRSIQKVRSISSSKFARENGEGYGVAPDSNSATCVICSTVTDGTSLLDVAQILRDRQLNHGINFLIGLTAFPTEKELKEVKSNLVYSQTGYKYLFNQVENIELPRIFREESTPWDREMRFWSDVLQAAAKNRLPIPAKEDIVSRLKALLLPGGGPGFLNDAFLSLPESKLELRPNSIFTKGLTGHRSFSQADVFLAVTVVLHGMRTRNAPRRLEQHTHKRSVISPSIFYRFSDGVIQAAFLRATKASELDYRMDRSLSKAMSEVLSGIFDSRGISVPKQLLKFFMRLHRGS